MTTPVPTTAHGRRAAAAALALLVVGAGCGGDGGGTGPETETVPVGLSVTPGRTLGGPRSVVPASASHSAGLAADLELSDGENSLVVSQVAIVVADVELHPAGEGSCDAPGGPDACPRFEAGPVLLSLPTESGAVERAFTLRAPLGRYDRLEFDIHRVTSEDADLLASNPTLEGASILVEGTFNGTGFVLTSDIDETRNSTLDPALLLAEGTSLANLTVQVSLESWFRTAVGGGGSALIDPRTAGSGGANESAFEARVRDSFTVFQDDDADGIPGGS